MSSWWLPHKGQGSAHLFTRHIWLGFLPLVLNHLGNDWHRKARRALSGLSLTLGSIGIHLLLSHVYFSFLIFWISPHPHPHPTPSLLPLLYLCLIPVPGAVGQQENNSNPPQHALKGHVLESCPWFCSAFLKRMETLGQGWLSPPLQGVSPFGLEATAVLPLQKSQDGGWGLKTYSAESSRAFVFFGSFVRVFSVSVNIIPSRMSFQTLDICFKGKSALNTGGNFNHIPIHSQGVSGN